MDTNLRSPRWLRVLVWLLVAAAPLLLLHGADPGLVKWPALAAALALAVIVVAPPATILPVDILAGAWFLYSLAHSAGYHDQWAVDLATIVAGLAYILGRWGQGGIPPAIAMAACWVIGIRGILDVLIGSIWGMGVPFMMVSFFVHKNMFAYLLSPLIWYCASRWKTGSGWVRNAWAATGGFLALVLASSQSRSALLAAVASSVAAGSVAAIRGRRIRPAALGLAGAGVLLLANLLAFHSTTANLKELRTSIRTETLHLPGDFHHTSSSEGRRWIWKAAIQAWKGSPWLGNGTGSTQYAMIANQPPWLHDERDPFMTAWHAHSHYLETLQDKGVVGLAVELALLATALVSLARGRDTCSLAIFAGLFALSCHDFVAEASEYPASIALFWALIGLGIRRMEPGARHHWSPPSVRWGVGVGVPTLTLVLSALAVRPVRADLEVLRAMQASDPKDQMAHWSKSLESWPDNPDALFALALNQAQTGDIPAATRTLDRVDSVAPGLKYTPILRSQLLLISGRADSARILAGKALAEYPFNQKLQDVLLSSLRATGRCAEFERARTSYLFQIDSQFLPRWRQDSVRWIRGGNRFRRDEMLLPRWAPESAFRSYAFVNDPKLRTIERDFLSRRLTLAGLECRPKADSLPAAAPSLSGHRPPRQ